MTTASTIQTEDLAGKRALVSGGTRGTGAAVAARLKRAGAHVTAVGRHPPEHLAADEVVPADITSVEGTDTAIEQMAANGGAERSAESGTEKTPPERVRVKWRGKSPPARE